MFEFKLALKYLKKNKKESITIISCIVVAITLILGVDIIGDSISINQINQAKEVAGYYDGTLVSNNKENSEKLKSVDGVYNISTVKNLGEIIIPGGLKSTLYSFNENYLKSLNYNLISGRYPKDEHEIIIDSKLLGKNDTKNILNKNISVLNKIEYKLDGIRKIYSKKGNFKVVGIVSKVDSYYNLKDAKIDSFIGSNKSIIPEKFITYSTIYNIRGINETNIDQKFSDIRKKYNPSTDNTIDIRQDTQSGMASNEYLDSALRLYGDFQQENQKELKILVAITSALTIFNFFNIIISKLINQIGYLRVVGMSNKKITRFYLIQMLILFVIGSIIGFITSMVFARYSMGVFVTFNLFNISNFSKVKLIISPFIVFKSLLITLFTLLISISLPIIKSLKKYPMDLINKSDKVKYKTTKNGKLLNTLLKNNLLRSKSKTIISIAIIAFSGFVCISYTSSNMKNFNKQLRGNLLGCKKEYDYMIRPYENADGGINKLSIKEIYNLKKYEGIKDFSLLGYTTGFISVPKNDLNKSFLNIDPIKSNNKGNIETMVLLSGIDNYNKLNKYVNEGSLKEVNKQGNKLINVAICNEDYISDSRKMEKIIKNLKIGDIFEFKVTSKKDNGEFKYETYKCRVNAILDGSLQLHNGMEDYGLSLGMYMNLNTLKSITDNNYIQEVNFNIDGNGNNQLDKLVDNIDKKYNFIKVTTINSKTKDVGSHFSRTVILGGTLLIAALFNIYTTVSININNNISEFSILRAIGLKKKYLKKLVIYEALFYGFVGSTVGVALACIKEFKLMHGLKKTYAQTLGVNLKTSNIYIPPKEILIFMAISIIASILIGYFKSKLIDKIEIIEGINEN